MKVQGYCGGCCVIDEGAVLQGRVTLAVDNCIPIATQNCPMWDN